MKKLLLFIFPLLLIAPAAHAANLPLLNPDFTIVPTKCTSCPCSYAGTLQLIQNLINMGISLAFVVMILVIIYAGSLFLFSPANPGNREMGKTVLVNAVVGMVIVLCAWLFIDFIMKSIYQPSADVGQGKKLGPWNEILKGDSNDWCIKGKTMKPLYGGSPLGKGSNLGVVGGGSTGDENGNRQKLKDAGITIARNACPVGQSSGCTNVGNTNTAVLDQTIIVKKNCNCDVIVTGGSEEGSHQSGTYSHANGYKIDLGRNSALDTYLKSLTPNGKRSDSALLYKDKCGNEYALEGDHWDITVLKVCTAMK